MEEEKPAHLAGMPIFGDPIDFWVPASYPEKSRYLLDAQGNPYPSDDSDAIDKLLHDIEKRRVALTEKDVADHHIKVSTVFLVWNRELTPDREPIIYETATSIDDFEYIFSTQYHTKQEAEEGHREAVEGVEQLLLMMQQNNIDISEIAGLLE